MSRAGPGSLSVAGGSIRDPIVVVESPSLEAQCYITYKLKSSVTGMIVWY